MGDSLQARCRKLKGLGFPQTLGMTSYLSQETGSNIYAIEYMDGTSKHCNEYASCDIFGINEKEALLSAQEQQPDGALGKGNYPRLVGRDGESNVTHKDTKVRRVWNEAGYIFHVLIAMPAWKLVCIFFFSYISAYLVIGAIIYMTHGAHSFHGVTNYWDAVMFTGYTMTTVGFGNQYAETPNSNVLPMASVILGLLMDAFWLGIIFARISSTRPLRHTILFSKDAVIFTEPGEGFSTFACRLVNLRMRYPWVDLSVALTLATYDADKGTVNMEKLKVGDNTTPFIDTPWVVHHRIINDSPLAAILSSPTAFDEKRGEIICELNGQDPLTGNCMKKRFSYCANEIFSNSNFVNVVSTSENGEGYEVDIAKFHDRVPTEPVSAQPVPLGYGTQQPLDMTKQDEHSAKLDSANMPNL